MTPRFGLACLVVAAAAAVSPAAAQEYDRYGHALVLDAEGWRYIDQSGRTVLRPFLFDNGPDDYEEGLARFVKGGKMGFHNEALQVVVPAVYDFVFPFENGMARAGTTCRTHLHAEHTSVTCAHWEVLRNPARSADIP